MDSADDIVAQVRRDMQRAEKDEAKGLEMAAKARAIIDRNKAFLEVYESYRGNAPVPQKRKREGGKIEALLNAAAGHILIEGPAHVPELLTAIANAGLEVGGDNPRQRLAGYLSKSPEFVFDTKAGWRYVGDAKTNEAADTPNQETSAASSVSSNHGGSHGTALI